ncbi:hypothetical protein [Acetobacter sp. UBA5411]|uniref:hypothetical protein n=1 Tax=Acetobacter sp. UBA5411 TaxID=1945905 RepID=UPI0025BB61BD|nr:hypothetical protein [Acetobacter sp. UBA5411]
MRMQVVQSIVRSGVMSRICTTAVSAFPSGWMVPRKEWPSEMQTAFLRIIFSAPTSFVQDFYVSGDLVSMVFCTKGFGAEKSLAGGCLFFKSTVS